jgi:hypothetical protein
MDLGKLFRVLVIGGSALGAGCDPDELPPQIPAPDSGARSDAGEVAADSGPTASDAGGVLDAGEPTLCFCGLDPCCESLPDGTGRVLPGFECCWSTSC